jgi:hypothetical protein
MDLVLVKNFAVGFDTRGVAVAVWACCGDSVVFPGVLVSPNLLEPSLWIGFIGCGQVKALWLPRRSALIQA